MITAYNKKTQQLTQVEHTYLLKPAADWIVGPLISNMQELINTPTDRWIYEEDTTVLRIMTDEEYDLDTNRVQSFKRQQMGAMSNACQKDIITGYVSTTLGQPHWYDGSITDQLNLIGALTASAPSTGAPNGTSMYLACRDSTPDTPKEYLPHTPAQIRQVLNDGVAARSTILQKFNQKCMEIDNCLRVSDVLAVTWSS